MPDLGALGNLHLGVRAVDASARSNSPPSAAVTMEIGTRQNRSAPSRWKKAMRLDRQEDVEVARRTAAQARLALAGEADAGAVLDARRNVDRERALAGDAARAAAVGARIVDDLAAPVAVRAGALDREEALRRAHAAVAAAGRAWLAASSPALAPEPAQTSQVIGGRDLDRRGLAVEGLLEA